ncbi:MAG: acyloxyacyl hydrolase [Bacteroidota bacterium]
MNTISTLKFRILTILFLLPFLSTAQEATPKRPFWKSLSLSSTVYSGSLLKRGVEHQLVSPEGQTYSLDRSYLYALEVGVQSQGRQAWESVAKFPIYGIGLSRLQFQGPFRIGGPWALYGFYRGFAVRTRRWNWQYKFGFGASWDWEKQQIRSATEANIIGSDINSYIEIGSTVAIQLNKLLSIETGFGWIHYSNGNSRLPQKGINVIASSLGLRLLLAEPEWSHSAPRQAVFRRKNEIYGYIAYGIRQVDFNYNDPAAPTETYGLRYMMANLTIGFNRQLRPRLKLSSGFELNYDGTADAHPDLSTLQPRKGPVSLAKRTGFSLFGGMEWTEGPLAVVLHLGYEVIRTGTEDQYPRYYQRLGVKYHYTRDLFVGVNIRAFRYHVAKYIEWHMGIRRDL